MRLILVPVLCATALAGTAATAAQSSVAQSSAPAEATTQRILYICDTSAETRRAFRIEHGRVVYMTAEDVLAAQSRGERWSAPRCITADEAQRLARLRLDRAST